MRDPLSRTFAALADPTRRAMLARLSEGEANVSDLAEPFLREMSLPAVTKHLKVLEIAGLITKGRKAQWRPCQLNGEPLREAVDWMEQHSGCVGRSTRSARRLSEIKSQRIAPWPKEVSRTSSHLPASTMHRCKAVWDAWTIPEEVAQWWGPRGFGLTTHSRDLRTGGHWHYTMHGPDGTDYENTTQYLEVVPQQRMVYDHGGHKDRPPLFRVTALFTERDGRTQLDMSMAFATPEIATEMRGFIKKAGGEATWIDWRSISERDSRGQSSFSFRVRSMLTLSASMRCGRTRSISPSGCRRLGLPCNSCERSRVSGAPHSMR